MNKPLQIGITGGIGSGKSIITKIFSLMNVPVYDADSRARYLLNHDADIKSKIIQLLGDDAYAEGIYNNVWVAKKVFDNPDLLKQLNHITHPAVAEDYQQWAKQFIQVPFLVKEAALLIESCSYKDLDKLILVQSPMHLRIERILSRDKSRTKEQVNAIIARQIPDSEKSKYATDFVQNDEDTLLLPQIIAIYGKYAFS